MKILLVHNIYQQAGGEDVVFDQELQLLERHGHQVITYLRSNHELEQLSVIGQIGLVSRIISAEDSKQDIRKILREEKPDLVHAHNTFMMISPSIFECASKREFLSCRLCITTGCCVLRPRSFAMGMFVKNAQSTA